MFTRTTTDAAKTVTISFEGRELSVRKDLTIAAALLEAGITHFRDTPVNSSPRAPFCMMGVCFDCLVIVDGKANQQACMNKVRNGMVIERQSGVADILPDNRSEAEEEK